MIDSVGVASTGSTKAVVGSGISSMSLSLIAWNPRMEEPSNPSPSSKIAASKSLAGHEKCCHVPGKSQNLTSTTWMPRSRISSNTPSTAL